MSLRRMALKARIVFPQLLLGCVSMLCGSVLFLLHRHPGISSNAVAWLETDGKLASIASGFGLFLVGFWVLSRCCHYMVTHRITLSKGPLTCSMENRFLEETVRKLWEEYFDRPDLQVCVSIHRRRLEIEGQAPEAWDNHDELSKYVSHKLFSITGYWGDICLTTTPKAS